MTAKRYFVGLDVDVAAHKISASIGIAPWKLLAGPVTFSDSLEGYQYLVAWLKTYRCIPEDTVFCMEAIGYDGEPLSYYLAAQGYPVAIEPLVKVRRTFPETPKPKGYELGSQHVAKYAYRFLSQLHVWEPSHDMLEQIKTLLLSCEPEGRDKQHPKRNIRTIDAQMRQLLQPHTSIAQDWPCY